MSVGQGAGSQAGQQGSAGSQAGQQSAQGQSQQGSGSQAGQSGQGEQQQAQEVRLAGMLDGETLQQAWDRINGALATTRKQAAGYRQRLGVGTEDGGQQQQSDNQQGNGQGSGQQQQQAANSPESARIARLEAALLHEQGARRSEQIARQLTNALVAEGAINPELTLRMIDIETLDVGDDGKIADAAGAVRVLKSQMPQIFGDLRGAGDGGAGGFGSTAPLDFNAMIRRKAGF